MAEEQTEKQSYAVKLFQSHIARSHTETFNIEAASEEEARAEAERIVKEDREIDGDYDFEIENSTPVIEENTTEKTTEE